MNRLKELTQYINENRNRQIDIKDLAFNHCDIFLLIPAFAFLFSPLYHIISLFFSRDYPFRGFFTFNYDVNYVIYLSLAAGLVAFILYLAGKKRKAEKISAANNIPAVFFGLVCVMILISTIINGFTTDALKGDSSRGESIFSFLVYFLVFYLCTSLAGNTNLKKLLLAVFFISNTVVNVITLIDRFVTPVFFLEYSDPDALSSVFYQFNHYGYFLMLAIMLSSALFVLSSKKSVRIMMIIYLAVNTFLLVLNTTFGCFLACVAGFVFMTVIISVRERKVSFMSLAAFAVFMTVCFVAGLRYHSFINEIGLLITDFRSVLNSVSEKADFVPEGTENAVPVSASAAENAGTGRWGLWKATIRYIMEKPLTGWGNEGIHDMLWEESNHLNNRPHNEYLQYAAFFGIPALAFYLCGLLSFFAGVFRRLRKSSDISVVFLVAAFTYLVSAFFGNTMFYTAPYLFIFLGAAYERAAPSLNPSPGKTD